MKQFKALNNAPRLLIEAQLAPLQGTRFQPTGFPDLGAATYKLPNSSTAMLLLESSQSVANRLERTIWNDAENALVEALTGISYVTVDHAKIQTNSLLEAHRLNSSYIVGTNAKKLTQFGEQVKTDLEDGSSGFDFHRFAQVLARYDINCLLHGVFLEKIAGVARVSRALSGFIEAKNIVTVGSGGVKNDHIDPTGKVDGKKGASEGFGNVPYAREEYAAESITAYFSLDLAQIRSYRLGDAAEDLLTAMGIWKIQRFLDRGLRLRTACDLELVDAVVVKRPKEYGWPDHAELTALLPQLVQAAQKDGLFADPAVTVVAAEHIKAEKAKKAK